MAMDSLVAGLWPAPGGAAVGREGAESGAGDGLPAGEGVGDGREHGTDHGGGVLGPAEDRMRTEERRRDEPGHGNLPQYLVKVCHNHI